LAQSFISGYLNDEDMMKSHMFFLPWLVVAALIDWLVGRTLTRLAVFMPKSELITSIYQSLTVVGNLTSSLSAVLVMAAMLWIIWRSFRPDSFHLAALIWMSVMALNLIFLIFPAVGLLGLLFQILLLLALLVIGWQVFSTANSWTGKLSILLPVLALTCGRLYHITPLLYETYGLPGPAPFSAAIFNVGELFVVASVCLIWWVFGRSASLWKWILALIPVLAFVGFRFVNPSMAGILSIWSVGLTLYLPWPLYTISLWLAVVTILANFEQHKHVAAALILLAAGGYAPQLTTQAFFGLVALWCLEVDGKRLAVESSVSGKDFNFHVNPRLHDLSVQ
jgi:hypothetical protein